MTVPIMWSNRGLTTALQIVAKVGKGLPCRTYGIRMCNQITSLTWPYTLRVHKLNPCMRSNDRVCCPWQLESVPMKKIAFLGNWVAFLLPLQSAH